MSNDETNRRDECEAEERKKDENLFFGRSYFVIFTSTSDGGV